jgi:hypothetical protein
VTGLATLVVLAVIEFVGQWLEATDIVADGSASSGVPNDISWLVTPVICCASLVLLDWL